MTVFARWFENATTPLACAVVLSLSCGAVAAKEIAKKPSKPTKPQVVATKKAKPSKPEPPSPSKPSAKTERPVGKASLGDKIKEADNLCRRDLSWGKLQAVRDRCSDLEPRNSAAATYWRLTLSDDPNDLRKGYAPSTLTKNEVDTRLLLSAGRYHFARGQIREMEDLIEIARKQKLAGPEVDTLKRLAAGK